MNTYLTHLTALFGQPKPSHPTYVTRTALQLRPNIGSREAESPRNGPCVELACEAELGSA